MNVIGEHGQGRLPLLKPSELSEAQRSIYKNMSGMLEWARKTGFSAETETGELLGPFNAYLYSPQIAEGMLVYQQAEASDSALTPRLREVVILTVGSVWQAGYELYAHRIVAQSVGISTKDIDSLCAGTAPAELGPEGSLTQRFVLAVTRDHYVSNELYAEAIAQFGPKPLIDMIHLAGMYTTVCSLLNVFQIPVEK